MSEGANTSLSRKVLKFIAIVVTCLLGLLLIASVLVYTLLEPYAAQYLKEQVHKKSNGVYSLRFDDLDINLLTTSVSFSQLHLYPNYSRHNVLKQQDSASAYLFELKTPEFRVSQLGLIDLLFNEKLEVESIYAEKPDIRIIHDKEVTAEKKQAGQSMQKSLSGFIDSFLIEEINIPDATVTHLVLDKQLHIRQSIPRLSLRITELTLDSLQQANYSRPIKVDDIKLTVKEYRYTSPDSVYALHVGELGYSTKEEKLLARNVQLIPDAEANLKQGKSRANRSVYEVKAPLLMITDLNLIEAYRRKELTINHLVLKGALVEILEDKNIPAKAEFPELSDFYDNVAPFLTSIKINNLEIADAELIYRTKLEEVFIIHELESTDINLLDVKLDSAVLFSPEENFYADNLLIKSKGYTYKHPQSPYTIKVPSLALSTIGDYLIADSLQVIGDQRKNDMLKATGEAHYLIYNLFANKISFRDMDLVRALKTGKLRIGSLNVQDPLVDMLRDKEVKKAPYGNWLEDTYQDISGFVELVSIEDIIIDDATFTQHLANAGPPKLVQKLREGSLLASDLRIDSAFIFESAARIPLEALKLKAKDYTYWLPDGQHIFRLDKLQYSTLSEILSARSLELYPKNKQRSDSLAAAPGESLFYLQTKLFKATDLDLINAINTEKLALDVITLKDPQLAIYRTTDPDRADKQPEQGKADPLEDIFSLVKTIDIKAVTLEDGSFFMSQQDDSLARRQFLDNLSVTLKDIHLDAASLPELENKLPVQEISLTASDYRYRSPNGLYTITLDSLQYSSKEQVLTAQLFDVDASLDAHERLKLGPAGTANRNIFDISARRFLVTGLDLTKAYETGIFIMDEMLLVKPEVTITQDQNVPEETEETTIPADTSGSSTMGQIQQLVDIFRVENLRIRDGRFKINVLKDTIRRSQVIDLVSVYMEQLRLVSLEESDPLEMFKVDDIEVLIENYTYLLPDSLYKFSIGTIRSSLRQQSLVIDSLRLIPLYGPAAFSQKISFEKDRYEITVPTIRMRGIDLDALYNRQDLLIEKMLVLDPVISIYRDKREPDDPERQPGTLQDALLEADLYIALDSVKVISGFLSYAEIPEKGTEPGVVVLNNTYLAISNLTNDSLRIAERPIAYARGITEFMGASKLVVDFKFFLNHPEDYHTYEGSLYPMDFEAFNPLFTKLMFMRVESGFIDTVHFQVEANEHQAIGQMRFLYENLQVQLINKKEGKKPGFLKNAATWVLNTLVVKNNNPSRWGNYRKGPINTERDYSKSTINQMTTAMLDGMASAIMPNWVETVIGWFTDFP